MSDRILRALVTGASSGIGASFARLLAERGVEVVLVARDAARLESLARTLPTTAEVVTADLIRPEDRGRVVARLQAETAPVDLLVNNAGIGTYGALASQEPADLRAMIELNVVAPTLLLRAVLPRLLAQGNGGVITVGSIAGSQPGPYGAAYGGTKSYLRDLTRAVQAEVAGQGVHVMELAPGVTATEFHGRAGVDRDLLPGAAVMSPDAVVEAALQAYARGDETCVPGVANRAAVLGARLAPVRLSRAVAGRVHERMRG